MEASWALRFQCPLLFAVLPDRTGPQDRTKPAKNIDHASLSQSEVWLHVSSNSKQTAEEETSCIHKRRLIRPISMAAAAQL